MTQKEVFPRSGIGDASFCFLSLSTKNLCEFKMSLGNWIKYLKCYILRKKEKWYNESDDNDFEFAIN